MWVLSFVACESAQFGDRETIRFDGGTPDEGGDAEGGGEEDVALPPAPDDADKDTVEDFPDPVDQVCYPGIGHAWDVCVDVVSPDPMPAGYEYPASLDDRYAVPVAWLDLEALDPALAVADNFVLEELAQSWKGRYAVVQPHAVDRIQDLRDELGALVVNSGYRNPEYNASVGGVSSSRHMYGDAFDLDPVDATLDELVDACEANGAAYVGVYTAHIHCDWRDDDLDEVLYGTARRSARLVPGETWTVVTEGWDEGAPLVEWIARDGQGRVLATATSDRFVPPTAAAEVEALVGRELVRRLPTR